MNSAPVSPTLAQLGTPKSGLLRLRNAVAAYFELFQVPAVVAPVGLKYRSFALNQAAPGGANRVVFIPGEFDGSNAPKARKYGEISRSSRNHASVDNPREIASWDRPITISCWSAPVPGAPRDEGETIGLAEDLLEKVVRAVHESGLSDITWGGVIINAPATENGFGVELLLAATQRGPLFGVTLEYAQPTPKLPRE